MSITRKENGDSPAEQRVKRRTFLFGLGNGMAALTCSLPVYAAARDKDALPPLNP